MNYCRGESGTCKEPVKAQYKGIPLCSRHWFEAKKADDSYYGGDSTGNSDIVECNYCRGAYDRDGNYNPAKGKVFGRFNKRTKKCDYFVCNYYSQPCSRSSCHNEAKGSCAIFCSEECKVKDKEEKERKQKEQEKKFSQPCSQCKGSLGKNYFYKQNAIGLSEDDNKFCSQNCFQNFYQKSLKDDLEKRRKLINSMKNWEDISSYDWENADWLDEEDKKNCREWVKNYQLREKLKQEGKDYSNQPNYSDKISEEKVPVSSVSSDNFSNDQDQNNSPSSNFPSNSNGSSNDDQDCFFICSMCEKKYKDSEREKHDSENPNCQRLIQISEKASKNIEQGKLNLISDLKELPKKLQTYLIALQDIKINKKKVNIDNLELPEDGKQELRKIQGNSKNNYSCGNCSRNNDEVVFDTREELDRHMRDCHGLGKGGNNLFTISSIAPKIFIGGVLILLVAIILGVVLKKKKKNKPKKKLRKTNDR